MAAVLVGGLLGALTTPLLVHQGLRQLRSRRPSGGRGASLRFATGFGVGAAVTGLSATHVDGALIPALLVWALTLTALALCDAAEHRIPTPMVRQATVMVCALLAAGAIAANAWAICLAGFGWALVMTGAFAAAWRFAGAGRGDVRLAALGGLGLGFAGVVGLMVGVVSWAAIVTCQWQMIRAKGGTLKTEISLAPGLAISFLVAAIPPW